MKEKTYKVKGMHCASCEILIEKKLLELPGVKSVEASTGKGEVMVELQGDEGKLGTENLNKLFKEENYTFSETEKENESVGKVDDSVTAVIIIAFLILGFLILNGLGLTSLVSVTANSSLIMFFALGLIAGVSSCAALVGGIVLSMSKQWQQIYSGEQSLMGKATPHLLFNLGRLGGFGIFGGILGLLGSKIGVFSTTLTPILVVVVALVMIVLGLQMLGVKYFQRFQFSSPKFITRYVADEKNFNGKYMPFIMGALTFLLPCGFTITAEGIALLSGSPMRGAMIMMAFVLGTAPMLLGIGLASVKLSASRGFANIFPKVAGALVIFFAIFNLNAQMNVLGVTNISDISTNQKPVETNRDNIPAISGGKQTVKMNASASGYQPNYIKVKVGIPVRWEVTDTGTSGCTNAIISRSLFDGQIDLVPGQTSVKEFTPTKVGKYKFSCWMGMVVGTMEVI